MINNSFSRNLTIVLQGKGEYSRLIILSYILYLSFTVLNMPKCSYIQHI